MKQFELLTIADLKKLTEQFGQLEKENKLLKIKYPNKQKQKTAEELLEEVK